MSEPARNRFALDLEDLERQLRGAGQAPRPGQQVDPLAELTRIVEQDDPLKDIFAERAPAQVTPWPGTRQEPSFAAAAPKPAPVPTPDVRGTLDEFEALLRRTDGAKPSQPAPVSSPQPAVQPGYEPPFSGARQPVYASGSGLGRADAPRDLDDVHGGYASPVRSPAPVDAYEQGAAYESIEAAEQTYVPEDDMPDLEPRRSRRGIYVAVALVVVAVAGLGGAMVLRAPKTSGDGSPLLISADQAPVKVQPANPGGAEIPNQNKQIYERAGEAPGGQSKLVNSEEQPVDVQQAARTMPSRVVLAGPGAPATPTSTSPLVQAQPVAGASVSAEPALVPVPAVPGLGEPRRVRTVSIRPDGSPAAQGDALAGQPAVTSTVPSKPAAAAPTPVATSSQPPARPVIAEAPKAQERVAQPAATTPSTPIRLANAAPSAPAAAQPSAPATAAIRAGAGDFTVQLAAPGSEAEARATFSGLQRKYGSILGSYSPIIRKTDLAGGKTVYRLRVGPFSREDATAMCSQLQGAGGQCFISKN